MQTVIKRTRNYVKGVDIMYYHISAGIITSFNPKNGRKRVVQMFTIFHYQVSVASLDEWNEQLKQYEKPAPVL